MSDNTNKPVELYLKNIDATILINPDTFSISEEVDENNTHEINLEYRILNEEDDTPERKKLIDEELQSYITNMINLLAAKHPLDQ